jgi:hypothetical protein
VAVDAIVAGRRPSSGDVNFVRPAMIDEADTHHDGELPHYDARALHEAVLRQGECEFMRQGGFPCYRELGSGRGDISHLAVDDSLAVGSVNRSGTAKVPTPRFALIVAHPQLLLVDEIGRARQSVLAIEI